MKVLKNSTYDAMISRENELIERNSVLSSEVNDLKSEIDRLNYHNDLLRNLNLKFTSIVRDLRAENELLKIKAAKYDKEIARLKLKNQVARVKKMSAKRLAEKFLGTTVMFYDETPAIICGYRDKNVVICACNHEEKSWNNISDTDVILQEHDRYVYFASYKVALQIINHLKTQK